MNGGIRAKLRTLARVWLSLALVVVLLPMALGASFGTLTRLLGGGPDHVCMCGMKQGTCGCPECAHLEQQRAADKKARAYPIVKHSCTDDDGMPTAPPLPPAHPAFGAEQLRAATFVRVEIVDSARVRSQFVREPVTPPPRA